MGFLRGRAAALAVGVTLVSTAAAAGARTAPTTIPDQHTATASKRIRSETAPASAGAVAGARDAGAEPFAWNDRSTRGAETAAVDPSAAAAVASTVPRSAGGLRGSFPFAASDGGVEGVRQSLAAITLRLRMMEVQAEADADAESDPLRRLASSSRGAPGVGGDGEAEVGVEEGRDELAAKLIAGLDGPGRDDLASKLIAGLGEGGGAEEGELAKVLLSGLGGEGSGAGGDEEFAARLAEAALGAPGKGGELAEMLLAGLGRGGGERQKLLAAKLLAELDATQQGRGGGRGGGGGGGKDGLAPEINNVAPDDSAGRGRDARPAAGPEEKLSAAAAEALESVRRQQAHLAHLLDDWMSYKEEEEEEEEELPTRGLVKEPAWRGEAAVLSHKGPSREPAGSAAAGSDDVAGSLPFQLAGAFRRTFGELLRPFDGDATTREDSGDDAAAAALAGEDGDGAGDVPVVFGEAESAGWSAQQQRRRLQSSSGNGGNTQLEIVTMNGLTATDWNGAYYTLEVGTTVPGQTQPTGKIIARGTINEGEEPSQQTENLERGCYVIYTSAGTRPYDVLWEVQVAGELYQDVAGGGQDFKTFGVGGALCGMSECYRQCYEAHDDREVNDCASYGDLLAPSDELAGANCTCTAAEEVDLRLKCVDRGCDVRSQCYLLNDDDIVTAHTLTIVSYVTIVTSTIDAGSMEAAMAQWLDLNPQYVDLVRVNGQDTAESALTTRRRLGDVSAEGEDGEEGEWGGMEEERAEWQRQARKRGLQSTGTFKRLEFRIIGNSASDFPFTATLDAGVRGLQTVLAAQDEASGVKEVIPWTARYTQVEEERVARADIPGEDIGGSGGGTGVDEEGDVIVVATDAPAEFGDFTTSTQFLIGAGLVVVVSFFLSIVACIVCRMKRRDHKEFVRKNAPEDGRRKPVAYVDPWGSVARTFQKDTNGPANGSSHNGRSSTFGGQHANGSAHGRSGSRTANSSASA